MDARQLIQDMMLKQPSALYRGTTTFKLTRYEQYIQCLLLSYEENNTRKNIMR